LWSLICCNFIVLVLFNILFLIEFKIQINMKKAIFLPAVICILIVLAISPKETQARVSSAPLESLRSGNNAIKIDGFRSAQFGMTEKEILKSIYKDFKISKSKIKRRIHPSEKTVSFNFQVKDLLPNSGLAKLFYVFGFKTKRLIQVNILWSRTVDDKLHPQKVVDTANQLRAHFLNQGFQKEGLAINTKMSDGSVLVFRGLDARGKMVVLLLVNPLSKEGQPSNQNINLRLSYIMNPDSPDVYKIKKDDF